MVANPTEPSADRRFSVDGFHATTLALVADDAGYTKGAVYSNFSSKEDLFFAVYACDRVHGDEHRARARAPHAAGRGRP